MPNTAASASKATIEVAAAALTNSAGEILIAQRPLHKAMGGYWEFPGGKFEPGETAWPALVRELDEELGIHATAGRPLIRLQYEYPEKIVDLHVWLVSAYTGQPYGREGQPVQWAQPQALFEQNMLPADKPILTALRLPSSYWITPEPENTPQCLQAIDRVLAQGIKLIQLRAKTWADDALFDLAKAAVTRCHSAGAQLLLNQHIDIAQAAGCDGVHLTSAQLQVLQERPLPENLWVGASCHTADELAAAVTLGCDFAVLGPVQATPTHPDAQPFGWPAFAQAVATIAMPVFALGGLNHTDQATAWESGAQGVAGMRGYINTNQ